MAGYSRDRSPQGPFLGHPAYCNTSAAPRHLFSLSLVPQPSPPFSCPTPGAALQGCTQTLPERLLCVSEGRIRPGAMAEGGTRSL